MGVVVPNPETNWVDMTKSGKHCWNDGEELERVSEEERYTCHMCGAVYEEAKDKASGTATITVHFTGFK